MDIVNQVALSLQGQLSTALLYLLATVVVDLVLGVLVAGVIAKSFTLRKLGDFWVSTIGYQKVVAFAAAVVIMLVHGDAITHAGVAAMAVTYATAILPDIYDKLSTLLFGGKLPLSQSVASPPATSTPTQ